HNEEQDQPQLLPQNVISRAQVQRLGVMGLPSRNGFFGGHMCAGGAGNYRMRCGTVMVSSGRTTMLEAVPSLMVLASRTKVVFFPAAVRVMMTLPVLARRLKPPAMAMASSRLTDSSLGISKEPGRCTCPRTVNRRLAYSRMVKLT